jgi:uncharacterized protein (DUF736 family)
MPDRSSAKTDLNLLAATQWRTLSQQFFGAKCPRGAAKRRGKNWGDEVSGPDLDRCRSLRARLRNTASSKIKRRLLNAIGNVIKQANGRNKGTLRTVSIKADIDILPNAQKTSDSQHDFRAMTEGIKIDAGLTRKGETSNKKYASLSIAAPEFGPKKL